MAGDDFARLFDAQYADYDSDLPFWRALAEEAGDPVLELGCGTGRILAALASAGHEVTGIERSPAMIAAARIRLATFGDRVDLHQADLRAFMLDRHFACALVACNTFAELTLEEAAAVLRRLHNHLAPLGRLGIELPNPDEALQPDADDDDILAAFLEPQSGHPVQLTAEQTVTPEQLRVDVHWRYDELLPDGGVQRFEFPTTYYLRSEETMREMLHACGFTGVETFGDFDRRPLSPLSERMLLLATAGNSEAS